MTYFQDHVKEKLKLVQKFLHDDAQDQLSSLEEKMKSSEISMVCVTLRFQNTLRRFTAHAFLL